MKNRLFCAFLAVLLGCMIGFSPLGIHYKYKIKYCKIGDHVIAIIMAKYPLYDAPNGEKHQWGWGYAIKGREDRQTFKMTSSNNYQIGTEIELADNDEIEGSI